MQGFVLDAGRSIWEQGRFCPLGVPVRRKYFLKALNFAFLSKQLTLNTPICILIPTAGNIDGSTHGPQERARTEGKYILSCDFFSQELIMTKNNKRISIHLVECL